MWRFGDDDFERNLKGVKPTWTLGLLCDNTSNPACRPNNGQLDCGSIYTNGTDTCPAFYRRNYRKGLLSRSGFSVLNDTDSLRYGPDGRWRPKTAKLRHDLYVSSSAPPSSFTTVLGDFATISGAISMPPRAALGVWWSRYHAYSAEQLTSEVLVGYKEHGLPLDVLVIDMDWHVEELPKQGPCNSWNAWSFNRSLFPQPAEFLRSVQSSTNPLGHPLLVSLNLHPQGGVTACSNLYQRFARKCAADVLAGGDGCPRRFQPDGWDGNALGQKSLLLGLVVY